VCGEAIAASFDPHLEVRGVAHGSLSFEMAIASSREMAFP